jgi:hypothetical protein
MPLPLESVAHFVNDINAAAPWYAALLGAPVEHEDPRYAFVRTPHGVIIGFHPTDAKNPGGVPAPRPIGRWPTSTLHRPLCWRVAPRWTAAPPSQTSARAWRH